jgi:hypothetical protein
MIKLKQIIKETVQQINEGFDIDGYKGNQFHSPLGSWDTLVMLIERLNNTYNLNIKNLKQWYRSNGFGLKTQAECNKLADALESLTHGKSYNSVIRIPEKNNFSIEVAEILEFIDFLRKCGGFEIW